MVVSATKFYEQKSGGLTDSPEEKHDAGKALGLFPSPIVPYSEKRLELQRAN